MRCVFCQLQVPAITSPADVAVAVAVSFARCSMCMDGPKPRGLLMILPWTTFDR